MKRIYLGLAACLLLPTASFAGLVITSSAARTTYSDLTMLVVGGAPGAMFDANGFLIYSGGNMSGQLGTQVTASSTKVCATCSATAAEINGASVATFGSGTDALVGTPGGGYLGFSLQDGLSGSNASVMDTAVTAVFTVDGGGFSSSVGDFLNISGNLAMGGKAGASVTGTVTVSAPSAQGVVFTFAPILLASQHSGVFSAQDGSGLAASTFTVSGTPTGTGNFSGAGSSFLNIGTLTPGTTVTFNESITAFADPASFINGTVGTQAPEPGSLAMIGGGLGLLALGFRRKAKKA